MNLSQIKREINELPLDKLKGLEAHLKQQIEKLEDDAEMYGILAGRVLFVEKDNKNNKPLS